MTIYNSKIRKTFFIASFILFTIVSCGTGDNHDSFDYLGAGIERIIPTDLSLIINVVGADNANPNGDGSGIVQFTASASNAVKYSFKFGSEKVQESTTGSIEHTFKNVGTSDYTIKVIAYSSTENSISTSETITVFVAEPQLVWSDEFNTDGSPDGTKWGYDIGTGTNGWGNGESEYYTNRSENVIVEGGFLKITAKKENYNGSEYTSTRMLTKGKFDFTYGKVEVRAKLPFGEGTWPAIWMLGSNISSVGWPACGEIDIMEHWGHNQGTVQSALHTPSNFGENANHKTKYIADVSTKFHVYSMEWDKEKIIFSIDGASYYTYSPNVKDSDTWPYTKDQFIILNVAMGGSWFNIDPNFTQSTMEVDYVRVYQ